MRSADITVQDSLQRSRNVLNASVSLQAFFDVHSIAPLQVHVDIKFSPLRLSANVQQLATAFQRQPHMREPRRRSSRPEVLSNDGYDRVFPKLPIEFVKLSQFCCQFDFFSSLVAIFLYWGPLNWRQSTSLSSTIQFPCPPSSDSKWHLPCSRPLDRPMLTYLDNNNRLQSKY